MFLVLVRVFQSRAVFPEMGELAASFFAVVVVSTMQGYSRFIPRWSWK